MAIGKKKTAYTFIVLLVFRNFLFLTVTVVIYRTVPLGMERFNPVIFLDLQNGKEAALFELAATVYFRWLSLRYRRIWPNIEHNLSFPFLAPLLQPLQSWPLWLKMFFFFNFRFHSNNVWNSVCPGQITCLLRVNFLQISVSLSLHFSVLNFLAITRKKNKNHFFGRYYQRYHYFWLF